MADFVVDSKVIASPSDTIGTLVARMRETEQWVVPVVNQGNLLGQVTYKDLLRRRISPDSKVNSVMTPTVTISDAEDVQRVVAKFYTSRARAIPVVTKERKFVGLVTRESLLSYLIRTGMIPQERVRKYMASPVLTVTMSDSVARARWLMVRDNVSRLPVMEGEKLAGIVSMRDIVSRLYEASSRKRENILVEEERIMAMPVKEIMNYPVITLQGSSTLEDVVNTCLTKKVSGIPILEGGRLAGIISTIDVIGAVAERFKIEMPIQAKLPRTMKNSDEKSVIDGIIERHLSKVERITEVDSFKVSLKESVSGENKKMYEANVRASTRLGNFVASDSDWDPATALRKAVERLEKRIIDRVKTVQRKKRGEKGSP
ncbi:histidine kinase [Sulfodiicoccus acidiphilus]|uniref:Histidine kinase n=1 Tax=Sulfodiicoccus acidiphilus TaxID=1670455 RepID=A0A348B3P8_9CREN|nr:CBS domain-containing protein [Sulfodiicoccus acidiphilus]BBD72800.1 histidine kinase [Sulfodiicoccus acidiphilus]GGT99906.1 histidine kinase [Sulfodiicoccus acidiphilus]